MCFSSGMLKLKLNEFHKYFACKVQPKLNSAQWVVDSFLPLSIQTPQTIQHLKAFIFTLFVFFCISQALSQILTKKETYFSPSFSDVMKFAKSIRLLQQFQFVCAYQSIQSLTNFLLSYSCYQILSI